MSMPLSSLAAAFAATMGSHKTRNAETFLMPRQRHPGGFSGSRAERRSKGGQRAGRARQEAGNKPPGGRMFPPALSPMVLRARHRPGGIKNDSGRDLKICINLVLWREAGTRAKRHARPGRWWSKPSPRRVINLATAAIFFFVFRENFGPVSRVVKRPRAICCVDGSEILHFPRPFAKHGPKRFLIFSGVPLGQKRRYAESGYFSDQGRRRSMGL